MDYLSIWRIIKLQNTKYMSYSQSSSLRIDIHEIPGPRFALTYYDDMTDTSYSYYNDKRCHVRVSMARKTEKEKKKEGKCMHTYARDTDATFQKN